MKIVFDSLVFALHKYGGVTTYWNEFISRFKKDRADLNLLTVPASKYLNEEFVELVDDSINQIPEKGLPLQILRNTSARIPSIRERFIFHSTYLRVSSNRSAINIVTIHDFTHQYFVKGLKQRLNYYQKRQAIRNSHGIVCISENTLKDLYHFFPESKSKLVRVIYNGCSSVYLDRTPVEPVVSLSKPYLLFVGARGNYKNFAFLLSVLAKSEYDLVVAGSKFTEEEEASISEFNGRLTILNNVTDRKLKSLYHHAHAFIYPSLYEGFGIPILEAMNCDCPVIAFNNSCIPEIMGNSPLLLENDDLEKTLRVLKELEDPQFRKSVLSAQRAQAGKFSWGRAYDEMKAFYTECVAHSEK
jgi:glycosyltransferase involved in cell wall biosynthesis